MLTARALGVVGPLDDISPQRLFGLTALTTVPIIVGTLIFARWVLRARPAELGLLRPRFADLRYGLIFGSGLFVASASIGLVQAASVGKEPQSIIQVLLGHGGAAALALNLLSIAILTPIVEELLFRGVLQGGLRQRLPFLAAAVIATALFTLVHERQAWPSVFVLGFGLALAYERTRTLWAPIATHATVNSIPLLLIAAGAR